ncbi:MAG: hypothetical protein AAGD10_01885 [Myxococcota bacterium]
MKQYGRRLLHAILLITCTSACAISQEKPEHGTEPLPLPPELTDADEEESGKEPSQ